MRNYRALVLSLALLLALLGLLLSPGGPTPPERASRVETRSSEPEQATRLRPSPPPKPVTRPDAAARQNDSEQRQARRRAVLDAAWARERAAAAAMVSVTSSSVVPHGPRDRVGGKDELVAAMSQDFMPLAEACIETALERAPELKGMLALDLVIVADAELGACVESAEFPDANEVHEPELMECVRAAALGTLLPPPVEDDREELMLTLPVGS